MADPRLSRPAPASRSRTTATMLPMAETTIGTPRYHGSASSARAGNSRQLTPATGTSSMDITATCTLILLFLTSFTDETVVMEFLLYRFQRAILPFMQFRTDRPGPRRSENLHDVDKLSGNVS